MKKPGRYEAAVIRVFGREAFYLTDHAEKLDSAEESFSACVSAAALFEGLGAHSDAQRFRDGACVAADLYAYRMRYEVLKDGLFLAVRVLGKLEELQAALKTKAGAPL